MIKSLALLFLLVGCAHQAPPTEKIIFVDMQTYKEWGTTRLVPIGRRPIPSEREICHNPLWAESCYKDERLRRKYFND